MRKDRFGQDIQEGLEGALQEAALSNPGISGALQEFISDRIHNAYNTIYQRMVSGGVLRGNVGMEQAFADRITFRQYLRMAPKDIARQEYYATMDQYYQETAGGLNPRGFIPEYVYNREIDNPYAFGLRRALNKPFPASGVIEGLLKGYNQSWFVNKRENLMFTPDRIKEIVGGSHLTETEAGWLQKASFNPNDIYAMQGVTSVGQAANILARTQYSAALTAGATHEAMGGANADMMDTAHDWTVGMLQSRIALDPTQRNVGASFFAATQGYAYSRQFSEANSQYNQLRGFLRYLNGGGSLSDADVPDFLRGRSPAEIAQIASDPAAMDILAGLGSTQTFAQRALSRIPNNGLPLPAVFTPTGRLFDNGQMNPVSAATVTHYEFTSDMANRLAKINPRYARYLSSDIHNVLQEYADREVIPGLEGNSPSVGPVFASERARTIRGLKSGDPGFLINFKPQEGWGFYRYEAPQGQQQLWLQQSDLQALIGQYGPSLEGADSNLIKAIRLASGGEFSGYDYEDAGVGAMELEAQMMDIGTPNMNGIDIAGTDFTSLNRWTISDFLGRLSSYRASLTSGNPQDIYSRSASGGKVILGRAGSNVYDQPIYAPEITEYFHRAATEKGIVDNPAMVSKVAARRAAMEQSILGVIPDFQKYVSEKYQYLQYREMPGLYYGQIGWNDEANRFELPGAMGNKYEVLWKFKSWPQERVINGQKVRQTYGIAAIRPKSLGNQLTMEDFSPEEQALANQVHGGLGLLSEFIDPLEIAKGNQYIEASDYTPEQLTEAWKYKLAAGPDVFIRDVINERFNDQGQFFTQAGAEIDYLRERTELVNSVAEPATTLEAYAAKISQLGYSKGAAAGLAAKYGENRIFAATAEALHAQFSDWRPQDAPNRTLPELNLPSFKEAVAQGVQATAQEAIVERMKRDSFKSAVGKAMSLAYKGIEPRPSGEQVGQYANLLWGLYGKVEQRDEAYVFPGIGFSNGEVSLNPNLNFVVDPSVKEPGFIEPVRRASDVGNVPNNMAGRLSLTPKSYSRRMGDSANIRDPFGMDFGYGNLPYARAANPPMSEEEFPGEHQYGEFDPNDLGSFNPGSTGLAGGVGGNPPNQPPNDFLFPDFDPGDQEPFEGPANPGEMSHAFFDYDPRTSRGGRVGQVMDWMAAGKSVVVGLPPGGGKTEYIKGATVARGAGVSIISTPQTSLNEQLEGRLRSVGINAFFLPGDPGYGAPQEKIDRWHEAHQSFYRAIHNSTEVLPGGGRRWRQGAVPVVGLMSSEKFAALGETGLGEGLRSLNNQGLLKSVIFDEAQEILRYSGGRSAFQKLASTTRENFPGVPALLSGGTINADQMPVLAGMFGIGENERILENLDFGHINFSAERVSTGQYARTGARYASEMEGQGRFIYSYSTKNVEQIRDAIVQGGSQALMYHKGQGLTGPVPEEELKRVSDIFGTEQVPTDTSFVMSSAAGLGINVNNVRGVGQIGPASASDILQRAARIRNPLDENGNPIYEPGTFNMAVDPRQYKTFAEGMQKDMNRLSPTLVANSYLRARAGVGSYSKNWIEASDQINSVIGAELERGGVKKYRAGDVFAMLNETGLIKYDQFAEGDQMYNNWRFTNAGGASEIAGIVGSARYQSVYDPRQSLQFGEFKGEIADRYSRENLALAKVFAQSTQLNPQEAGGLVKEGLLSYQKEGLQGLENFATTGLPKQLADKYVKAVTDAAEAFQKQAQTVGVSTEATGAYNKAVSSASQYIAGNPVASQFAQEQLGTMGAVAQAAGMPVMAGAFGQAAGVAGDIGSQGWGAGMSGAFGGSGGRGSFGGRGNALAAMLYGLYMERRWFGYTVGPELQRAAASASDFALPAMYGGADFNYAQSISSFSARQKIGQDYIGRGAMSEWGAALDLPYALSGFDQGGSISRIISANKIGTGITTMGIQAGASTMFLGSMLGPAAPIAWGVGGAVALTGAMAGTGIQAAVSGAELYNMVTGRTGRNAVTFDNFLRNTVGNFSQGVGVAFGGFKTGKDVLDYLKENRPELYNFINYQGEPADVRASRQLSERLAANIAGGPIAEQYVPALSQMGQLLGGKVANFGPQLQSFYAAGNTLGYGPTQYQSTFEQIGQQLGYTPGSAGWQGLMARMSNITAPQLTSLQNQASMVGQYAGQLTSYMPYPQAASIVQQYGGLQTRAGMSSYVSLVDMLQTYGADLSQPTGNQIATYGGWHGTSVQFAPETLAGQVAGLQQQYGPQVSNLVNQVYVKGLLENGGTPTAAINLFKQMAPKFAGMTQQQLGLAGQIAGGDLHAASFASYYQPDVLTTMGYSVSGSRWYDQSGQPIYKTSGLDFIKLGMANQFIPGTNMPMPGSGFFNQIATTQLLGKMSLPQAVGQVTGVNDMGMVNAWLQGGDLGAQRYAQNQMLGLQMASVGVGFAQAAEQQQYLWGGGAWTGTPAPGSLWYYEDQMRNLSYKSQMADFAYSKQRMNVSNQFAIQQEGLNLQRMNVSQGYQQWSMGFDYQSSLLQRGWTREDWQYQDQMRGLNFEWNLEDINNAIRRATGYQRQQLIKQRDRMGITKGLEDEQISKSHDRQEQMWAREDERYRKQTEYSESLMALDRKQFDLNKTQRETLFKMEKDDLERRIKEYQQQYKIQDQITKLQRDHQAKEIEFQKAQLGIQAQQIKVQQDLERITRDNAKTFDQLEGAMNNINSYSNILPILNGLNEMLKSGSQLSVGVVSELKGVMDALKGLDANDLRLLIRLLQEL